MESKSFFWELPVFVTSKCLEIPPIQLALCSLTDDPLEAAAAAKDKILEWANDPEVFSFCAAQTLGLVLIRV